VIWGWLMAAVSALCDTQKRLGLLGRFLRERRGMDIATLRLMRSWVVEVTRDGFKPSVPTLSNTDSLHCFARRD